MPRTRQAADASERGQPVAGPALLAVACVALAVGAPVVLVGLARAIRTATGVALRPVLLPGKLTVIPAHTNFSGFSPTYLSGVPAGRADRAYPDLPGGTATRRLRRSRQYGMAGSSRSSRACSTPP